MDGWTGLEPAASCVTGKRCKQLSESPVIHWREVCFGHLKATGRERAVPALTGKHGKL